MVPNGQVVRCLLTSVVAMSETIEACVGVYGYGTLVGPATGRAASIQSSVLHAACGITATGSIQPI